MKNQAESLQQVEASAADSEAPCYDQYGRRVSSSSATGVFMQGGKKVTRL